MISFNTSQSAIRRVGNDAGWGLSFHRDDDKGVVEKPVLVLTRESYFATIEASLAHGLRGGTFNFTVEGITDEHYEKIARPGHGGPTVVRLYLYWRDTNSSVLGYLSNVAGLTDLTGGLVSGDTLPEDALVAELAIRSVKRQLGPRRYEAVISAEERVAKRMAAKVKAPQTFEKFADMAEWMTSSVGVKLLPWDLDRIPKAPGDRQARQRITASERQARTDVAEELGQRLEAAFGKYGRGMLLIRDGVLHVGPRWMPLDGAEKPLSAETGLFQIEADEPAGTGETARKRFRLTLKGRGDLKPGDIVTASLPPEEAKVEAPSLAGALLGSLSALTSVGSLVSALTGGEGEAKKLYVTGVTHRMGRTAGFVTAVQATQVDDDVWDKPPDSAEGASGTSPQEAADPAHRAAQMIHNVASRAASIKFVGPEIGEVRAVTVRGTPADDPPPQTITVWRGLVESDGLGGDAFRLPVDRDSPAQVDAVPYATPFAFGKCGLVLPRYPGTRVVLVHRQGQSADPIDVGATWRGTGPASEPGDWWLSLPAEWTGNAERLQDKEVPPDTYDGKVSNDLIDAKGHRVIEAGSLTITVGQESGPKAGTRPTPAKKATVTISHASKGALLSIDENGAIVIKGKSIKLDATGGTIEMNADDVNIKVKNKVDIT